MGSAESKTLEGCERVYRTMWRRPTGRALLVAVFLAGLAGLPIFLNPAYTTPPGEDYGGTAYMPVLFLCGWLLLMAIFPVWWTIKENYGRVGVCEDGLLVVEDAGEEQFVGWDEITALQWSTLGVTEPAPRSYRMTVITEGDEVVETGYAHLRRAGRDMEALRDEIIRRCDLQETQVRPHAWFEDGQLQIAGMEHVRRWQKEAANNHPPSPGPEFR